MRPLRDLVVLGMSSAGGLGYAPVAPGTFGTLAGLPLWWLFSRLPLAGWAAAVLAVAALSVVVAARAEAIYGSHDVQRIVIDEVAGFVVASFAVPFGWWQAALSFALFRLFDATKPPPIGWLDRRVSGGFGVVVDDLAAGALACAVVHAVMRLAS